MPELLVLIEKTSFPIIITANDIWQQKYSLLRKKCQLVSVKELNDDIVKKLLQEIIQKENQQVKPETLNIITKKAKGDIRAALNDLQTAFTMGEDSFLEESHEREKEESIFNSLKRVFQDPTNKDIISTFNNTSMDLNEITLWIEENIPSEYTGQALAKAYEALSKADLFKGRIYRQQYWRFLVYQNFFLTAGISSATKLKSKKFTQYKRPSRILKIWLANQKNAKKKVIVNKFAEQNHMSKKKAMRESFLLPLIITKETEKKMDLDEKEQKWLEERRGAIIIANNLNKFRI